MRLTWSLVLSYFSNGSKVAFLKHKKSGNTSDENQNINTAGKQLENDLCDKKRIEITIEIETLKKLQIIKNHVLSPVQIIYRVVS